MEAPLQRHCPGGAADAAEVVAGHFVQVGDAFHAARPKKTKTDWV